MCHSIVSNMMFSPTTHTSHSALLLSSQYLIAIAFSVLEFFIELMLFPEMKSATNWTVFMMGIVLVIIGEVIRKAGMITAGVSFTHRIQTLKRPSHQLITHGIYKYVRHPAYLGWLLWAPATQIILLNPVSFGIFLNWAWLFFKHRIEYEEQFLIEFFGQRYIEYRNQTWTWIPFVK